MERNVDLLVYMPHARDPKAVTVNCLAHMLMRISSGNSKAVKQVRFLNPYGASNIARTRQEGVKMAREIGATHLLMIDDDMVFPGESFDMLHAHNVDVVGVNYVTKSPVAPRWVAVDANGQGMDSSKLTGLQESAGTGGGLLLIRVAALDGMEAPLFNFEWNAEKDSYVTEDHYFFQKCRKNGIKCYVDHDLSKDIYHVGDFYYGGCGTLPGSLVQKDG